MNHIFQIPQFRPEPDLEGPYVRACERGDEIEAARQDVYSDKLEDFEALAGAGDLMALDIVLHDELDIDGTSMQLALLIQSFAIVRKNYVDRQERALALLTAFEIQFQSIAKIVARQQRDRELAARGLD